VTDDWRWVRKGEALEIHEMQLAAHGGLSGIRDEGLLDSALAQPRNLAAYGETDDPCALAASYGYSIARNHPFLDGNKRTAFVVAAFFLSLQNIHVKTTQKDVVTTILALAAGTLSETEFADWLRANTAPKE